MAWLWIRLEERLAAEIQKGGRRRTTTLLFRRRRGRPTGDPDMQIGERLRRRPQLIGPARPNGKKKQKGRSAPGLIARASHALFIYIVYCLEALARVLLYDAGVRLPLTTPLSD